MTIPSDYPQRVYAGVLGKLIGVYLGRPFEGWTDERIQKELGEVWYFVNDRLKHPLVVADDDISGTFTFVRALEDHGLGRELTAKAIGQTWLNYIIEGRTILWWGGLGNSTEHTAYLRLKSGIPAPRSGSSEVNGTVVAEQIGAQIFIDAWAMVCPGDPQQAADFARKAASVSHDGEAVYASQVIAAMEAQAFVEGNLAKLLDVAVSFIPKDATIYRLIDELRSLRQREEDWHAAWAWLKQHYGYDQYGGNCHIVPNHGLIHLGLLWGRDDFQRTLMITGTCGWDTDCNLGNVGCLLGIKNGLRGIDAGADFRSPVADRLYLPTADGGRAVTDAVRETFALVNLGRALAGQEALAPKDGARFHFELPGSVQGFLVEPAQSMATATIENVAGHSSKGQRSLAIHYRRLAHGRTAAITTATFIGPQELDSTGYGLMASPSLYSGQTLHAGMAADSGNTQPVAVRLILKHYDACDALQTRAAAWTTLDPGQARTLRWEVPDTQGMPIASVGVELQGEGGIDGTVYLDDLSWSGDPRLMLACPRQGPHKAWRGAWVDAADILSLGGSENLRVVQNTGRGLVLYGAREWRNYQLRASVTPHLVRSAGLAARVQGLRRYYAVLLRPSGRIQLVKVRDDRETVLAEALLAWQLTRTYDLVLTVRNQTVSAGWGGGSILEATDTHLPFDNGAIALISEEGRCAFGPAQISPAE